MKIEPSDKGKAIIKYNLQDLTSIKIYSLKGEFICNAPRVTETHPLANEMGDIKDIEDYKQKIEKQAKLRRKTIKAVKEHFNLENIELIKKELMESEPEEQPEIKHEITQEKIVPKVKTSIVARPIFKTNYERYEWHLKNGCIGQDDRRWFENYINSAEYREIYK